MYPAIRRLKATSRRAGNGAPRASVVCQWRFLMKARSFALIPAILGLLSSAQTLTPPNGSDQSATAGVSAQHPATDFVAVAPFGGPAVPRSGSVRDDDECLYD